MDQERQQYIDLMTDPMVAALGPISGKLRNSDRYQQSLTAAMDKFIYLTDQVEWETLAVDPPQSYEDADHHINYDHSRAGHAERLVGNAFLDTEYLIDFALSAVKAYPEPLNVSLGRLLLRSERSLLRSGRLSEPDKEVLFSAVEYGKDYTKGILGFTVETDLVVVSSDMKGKHMVSWEPQVDKWIQGRTMPGGGCPAHRKIIEVDNQRMSLMHLFWNRVVRACFDV